MTDPNLDCSVQVMSQFGNAEAGQILQSNIFEARGGPARSSPIRPSLIPPLTDHRTSHRDRPRPPEKVECPGFATVRSV